MELRILLEDIKNEKECNIVITKQGKILCIKNRQDKLNIKDESILNYHIDKIQKLDGVRYDTIAIRVK